MWYVGIDMGWGSSVIAVLAEEGDQARVRKYRNERSGELVEFLSRHRPFPAVIEARVAVARKLAEICWQRLRRWYEDQGIWRGAFVGDGAGREMAGPGTSLRERQESAASLR